MYVSSEHTKEEGVLNTSRLIKIYVDKYDIVLLFCIQYEILKNLIRAAFHQNYFF